MDLATMIKDFGVEAISFIGIDGNTRVLVSKEIKELHYDPMSGGIFYKLVPGSQVIPTTDRYLYIAPPGILQIAFNERRFTDSAAIKKALDDLPH